MILRASLDTAVLMLDYARWPVKEDEAAKLLMDKERDNEDRAITPCNLSEMSQYHSVPGGFTHRTTESAGEKITLSRRVVAVCLW